MVDLFADAGGAADLFVGDRSCTRRQLLTVAAALAAKLPAPQPGSHIAFAFEHDPIAFAIAVVATWLRGHAVALPVNARRHAVVPLLGQPEVAGFLHDTGAGTGICVSDLMAAADAATSGEAAPANIRLGPVTIYTALMDGAMQRQLLTAEQLAWEITEHDAAMQLQRGAAVLNLFTPAFPPALVPGLLAPMRRGCLLLPRPAASPAALRKALAMRPPPTLLVPTPLLRELARGPIDVGGPARAFTLGDELDAPNTLRLQQRGIAVQHLGSRRTRDAGCERLLDEAWRGGALDAAVLRQQVPGEAIARLFAAVVVDGPPESPLDQLSEPTSEALAPIVHAVRRLPRDANGVLTDEALLRCLGRRSDGSLPSRDLDWQFRTDADGRFVGSTRVPADYFAFAGHFVTYPVLSGAVQLHELVLPCLRAARPESPIVTELADLKFLVRIVPGDALEVVLAFDAGREAVDFEIRRGALRCSTGRLLYRGATVEGP